MRCQWTIRLSEEVELRAWDPWRYTPQTLCKALPAVWMQRRHLWTWHQDKRPAGMPPWLCLATEVSKRSRDNPWKRSNVLNPIEPECMGSTRAADTFDVSMASMNGPEDFPQLKVVV
eukprot:s2323_g18.t1